MFSISYVISTTPFQEKAINKIIEGTNYDCVVSPKEVTDMHTTQKLVGLEGYAPSFIAYRAIILTSEL
jgi:hypothetical protein